MEDPYGGKEEEIRWVKIKVRIMGGNEREQEGGMKEEEEIGWVRIVGGKGAGERKRGRGRLERERVR